MNKKEKQEWNKSWDEIKTLFLKREEIEGNIYPVLNRDNWFVDERNRLYKKIQDNRYFWFGNMLNYNIKEVVE